MSVHYSRGNPGVIGVGIKWGRDWIVLHRAGEPCSGLVQDDFLGDGVHTQHHDMLYGDIIIAVIMAYYHGSVLVVSFIYPG